jgi:DNA-binding NarL/FixJ family response regulator
MDLVDRAIIQIDVPSGTEALEEIKRGECSLVVTDLELGSDIKGFELALRIGQQAPETPVIILADVNDPHELDEETIANSPFVYLHRPVDSAQFSRVIMAALDGKNMKEALQSPVAATSAGDFGPVPAMDLSVSQTIIDKLLSDLGAMAIILSSRAGDVLLGRGAVGYMDNERLSKALLPLVPLNVEFKDLVGGQASSLQFYDGDTYDVFVLSVGLHYFLSVVFDGQVGARQLGAVTRYGRRAAEDMIALLGANAWMIQQPVVEPETSIGRKKAKPIVVEEEEEVIELAKADFGPSEALPAAQEEPALQLAPITDFDPDKLFDQQINLSDADDLFDLGKMEEIAEQSGKKQGTISWEDAEQLGVLKRS